MLKYIKGLAKRMAGALDKAHNDTTLDLVESPGYGKQLRSCCCSKGKWIYRGRPGVFWGDGAVLDKGKLGLGAMERIRKWRC